jgi:cobalt-zinc-cadmium efflux system outer membrane protein
MLARAIPGATGKRRVTRQVASNRRRRKIEQPFRTPHSLPRTRQHARQTLPVVLEEVSAVAAVGRCDKETLRDQPERRRGGIPMRRTTAVLCAAACAAVVGVARAQDTLILPAEEYVALHLPEALPPIAPEAIGLRLEDVEQIALAANPTMAEAAARVRAARGQAYQAGLPPNPTFGYAGSEIGNENHGGQNGLVVGQEFIRGGKLRLDRAIEGHEAVRREQHFAAQQQRVLTDVRLAFYSAFLAERRLELSRSLQLVGNQSVATANALLTAQEGRRTDLLQAEIESQRANIDLAQAESAHRGSWRRLAAAVGQPDLPVQPLIAEVDQLAWSLSWEDTLAELWSTSPEIAAALAEIEKARCALARARVEPVPDVTAQAMVQYDANSDNTIGGAQVTLPVPLWNRNQGGIVRAQGDLAAANRRLEMVELRLQRDLAAEFQAYETAAARAKTISAEILGRAQQTLDAATQGYQAGELDFLAFLTVQRTYFQANLEYLAALGDLCQSVELLRGQLLSGGYDHADAPQTP